MLQEPPSARRSLAIALGRPRIVSIEQGKEGDEQTHNRVAE
jgi:hypothetical protein